MPKNEKETTKKNKRSLEAKGFYSDCEREGTLYAALIRSPAATGKVKSITIPELPEGYFLFTADDIPGNKNFSINNQEWKVFGYDNISYSGEPLGILCGPDEDKLFELLDTISVNFDIESLESALTNAIKLQKRPVVQFSETEKDISNFVSQLNDLPSLDNVLDNNQIEQDVEKIIAQREIKTGLFQKYSSEEADSKLFDDTEDFISSENWNLTLLAPNWKETSGAFCYTDGKDIHIYSPTRWTKSLMDIVASTLGISEENIFVHKTKTSGIFSKGMWRTSVIAAQVAVASYLTSKPIKLILSQKEQEAFMSPGVNTNVTYKTAISSTGIIKAIYAYIDVDTGCYNPFAQEIIDRMTIAACNYYKPQNVHIVAKAHTSKNPPTSICLKGVDSQIFFAIENQMQKITDQTNLLPEEIRLINKDRKKVDYPFIIECENASETFNEAIKMSDFNRKYSSFHMDAIDRVQENSNPFFALPLRGIGAATAFNVSEYYGETSFTDEQKVELTLSANEHLVIHTIKPSEGVQEIWKNTAAEILQIKKNNIIIDSEFSIDEISNAPEDNYNTISTLNELIKKACVAIQKKRFHQPLPITITKSSTSNSKKYWDKDSFSGIPFGPISLATTVIEVELDTYTYNERIKGLWMSIDCGELYDKAAALRALRLEIQQELSMLVKGKTIPCDNINISFIESKNKSGQIGELVRNTMPAAFSSALSLALATQVTKIPCTEKQLFELIKKRETRIEQENQGEQE